MVGIMLIWGAHFDAGFSEIVYIGGVGVEAGAEYFGTVIRGRRVWTALKSC